MQAQIVKGIKWVLMETKWVSSKLSLTDELKVPHRLEMLIRWIILALFFFVNETKFSN